MTSTRRPNGLIKVSGAPMTMHLSRRHLLGSMALIGVSACTSVGTDSAGRVAGSATNGASTASSGAGIAALSKTEALTRAIERSSFGATTTLREQIESAGGFEKWIDRQVAGTSVTNPQEVLALLDRVEARNQVHASKFESNEQRSVAIRVATETITARTVIGAAYGADQLRQRVVNILADLLHVSSGAQPEVFGICQYDQVLRDGAFGRFSDLLLATAREPAMLAFLDQASSRADKGRTPNENYAREVMELHTVGVDGGYDEGDVVELAYVLTGWTADRGTNSFLFRPMWHDLGPFGATGGILGWRPSASEVGEKAGVAALEHLAHHPSTAKRLAHLFARSLVSESIDIEDDLVVDAARVFSDNDTRIGPMVKYLLTDDRFAQKATLMIRRPVDMVAHILRVAGEPNEAMASDESLAALVGMMRVLGQVPYGWPAPNGYPTVSAAWSNAGAVISRWNAIVTLASSESTQSGNRSLGRFDVALNPAAAGASRPADLVGMLCGPKHQLV